MTRAPFLSLLLLAGCDAAIKVDPDGYRCDVGNLCPTGFACREGICRASTGIDPTCATLTCNTPPASSCVGGNTLRTFAGGCVAGQCQYTPVDSTCATGCANDACVDACAGVPCVTPPQAACTNANTLRTFAQTGSCSMGACSYSNTDTVCANGCELGRCKGVDLCQSGNVMCNTAPGPVCVGSARRAFTAVGTCDPGTGTCTYASSDSACSNGCALGQCLTASLAFAQTGPRVHFAINGIDVAPGSSGNTALAVGNAGKIARWDGSMWTELTAPSTMNLNKVAFVTGTLAYAVGPSSTVLTVRPATNQVARVMLSGSGNANLVAVSGRDVGEVLLASESGDWWRQLGGNWSNGTLASNTGPYTITGAFLDESLRERIVGLCGSAQCVAYRFLSGATMTFQVDTQSGTPGFTAVGGAFDVASNVNPLAMVGSRDDSLDTHSNLGNFVSLNPTPALTGDGVVGITAQAVAVNRDVFVLTSSRDPDASTSGKGSLYRLTRGLTQTTTTLALETYFGEEELSPNEANGVLVAEVRRAEGINNVFRRGVLTNEALDVGEDFIGASVDDQGAVVLSSRYGDVVVRRPTASTFDFRRPPGNWGINGLEARNGTGALLVGEDLGSGLGLIARATSTGITPFATRSGTVFNAVCRTSDTEAWAVGTNGAISKVTSTGVTTVTSPTTKELLTVDCAPGVAIAAGADGTVLRMTNNTWSLVSPALPVTGRAVTTARLTAGLAFVGGDGFFLSFAPATNTWTQLTAKAGLRSLVVRGPQEVYGAFVSGSTSEVLRFDGLAWGPRLAQVSGALGGGVQAGSRVVWGGTLGAIVEAR